MAQQPRKPMSRREQIAQQQREAAEQQRRRRTVAVGSGVLALVLIAALATWAVVRHDRSKTTVTPSASTSVTPGAKPPNAATDGLGLIYNPQGVVAGVPVLIEYHDYQCSACKTYHEFYGNALKQLADEGKIVYQLRTLTFIDSMVKNDSSTRAANAAACAATVGHYADYFDAIYANSPKEGTAFTAEQLRVDWPAKAGISGENLTRFQACYDAQAYSGFVKAVDTAGMNAGISTTPTYLVNGKSFDLSAAKGNAADVLAAITKAAG